MKSCNYKKIQTQIIEKIFVHVAEEEVNKETIIEEEDTMLVNKIIWLKKIKINIINQVKIVLILLMKNQNIMAIIKTMTKRNSFELRIT